MTIQGIDVSSENGTWNWDPWQHEANTPEGLNFAFARAKSWDGSSWDDDSEFQSNWRAMLHLGIVRGAYGEPRPGLSEPSIQATEFWRGVMRRGGLLDSDLIVCALDPVYSQVEPAEFTSEWYVSYCMDLNRLFPRHRVLVYMDLSTADGPIAYGLNRWHLILAQYQVKAPTTPLAWAKDGITFWQYQGDVPPDRDLFIGTREELDTFALAHYR